MAATSELMRGVRNEFIKDSHQLAVKFEVFDDILAAFSSGFRGIFPAATQGNLLIEKDHFANRRFAK